MKDKAKELVEKYEDLEWTSIYQEEGGDRFFEDCMSTDAAKQCALIAVDEILEVLSSSHIYNPGDSSWDRTDDYWQGVKEEIKKR